MSVRTNSNHKRAEEDGEAELVLVAVTYTGTRSMFGAANLRTEGGYPSLDQFRGPGPDEEAGETKLVYLPSDRLGWWENHADFEVAYDGASMAKALLTQNYIPEQIVGPGFDTEVRDDLTEKLGLEPFTGEDDLRGQLRDIAGVTAEEDEEAQANVVDEPNQRVDALMETDRSVLIKVANSYDDIDDLLDELEKGSVSHLGQTELAEYLAEKDDDEVDRRVSTAEQGGDI